MLARGSLGSGDLGAGLTAGLAQDRRLPGPGPQGITYEVWSSLTKPGASP